MSDHSIVKEEPAPVSPPAVHQPEQFSEGQRGLHAKGRRFLRKVTTKEGWFGDYNYAWLCMPTLPFAIGGRKRRTSPPFYPLDSDLPLLLALACGLQHALAMLAGLITPPIIFASALNLDSETSAYMISASLIGCGMLKFILYKNHQQRHLTRWQQASSVWYRCPGCHCSRAITSGQV